MRAQAAGRLGRSDRRTWLGRVRDAVDSLVRKSPSRFAILIFAGADPDLHPAVLAADRAGGRGLGRAAARRALHRGVGHLRHRPRDRRHGDVLVAVRQRPRLHRREHRRRRRADARVDPRPRHLASARAARQAARGERHQPVAHPRGPGRRATGRPPRRGRRPARHGRDQRPRHRGRRSPSRWSRACSPRDTTRSTRSGTASTTRRWRFTNTGFSPNPGGLEPFAHDYWFQTMLMIGVFLGSLGFPVIFALARIVAHAAPLERAREAHAHHHGHPASCSAPAPSSCSSTTTRRPTGSSTPATRSSSRSSCRP